MEIYMINDTFQIVGDLRIKLRNILTGEITVDRLEKNLVVTVGKSFIASRMAGNASAVMGWMAVGTNNTAPSATDTTLNTELARVATTVSGGTPSGNTVQYIGVYPAGVATGALTEAGIFNASSAGTMLSRTTYPVINKGASDEMTITWVITVG